MPASTRSRSASQAKEAVTLLPPSSSVRKRSTAADQPLPPGSVQPRCARAERRDTLGAEKSLVEAAIEPAAAAAGTPGRPARAARLRASLPSARQSDADGAVPSHHSSPMNDQPLSRV